VGANDDTPGRWSKLATGHPAVLHFYFRQSPQPLASTALSGEVSWRNPPLIHAGMAGVRFDLRGHLVAFYAIPPQVETAEGEPTGATPLAPDWSVLFTEARLDAASLRPVASTWTPPFYCEERAAWEGTYPDRPDIPIRVEAAAYRGRPVSFSIVHPWTRPERMQPHQVTPRERAALFLVAALALTLLCAGAVLARRNVRLGRGDRRGAFRLALFVFGLGVLAAALVAHHMADLVAELALTSRAVAGALLLAAINWLFYLALEPYVRRLRPRTLVSWTRVLSGGFGDAAVGQDVLIGAVWGTVLMLVLAAGYSLPQWLGGAPTAPWFPDFDAFLGTGRLLALLAGLLIDAVHLGMGALLLYLLLRLVIRNDTGATAVLLLLMTGVQVAGSQWEFSALPLLIIVSVVIMGSYTWLLLRFGLLSALAGVYVFKLMYAFPLSTDFGSWRGAPTIFVMLVLAALAITAFRVSLKPGSSVARGLFVD
jgi:hypothetical protein